MTVQVGLCKTRSETQIVGFLIRRLNFIVIDTNANVHNVYSYDKMQQVKSLSSFCLRSIPQDLKKLHFQILNPISITLYSEYS